MLTDTTGPVELDVPRYRASTFGPQIVKKRQRRLSGVDEVVLSLYTKGLTTEDISAHFAEIYGASVSKETISRITDKVIEEMTDWPVRPLDETCAAIFIDAIVVKVRDGQVANRPFYPAIGVTLAGERNIHGLWVRQVKRALAVADVLELSWLQTALHNRWLKQIASHQRSEMKRRNPNRTQDV